LIERKNKDVSVKRQCELLYVHRSAIYSKQSDPAAKDLELMRLIDEQYLKTPFYGSWRMTAHLRRQPNLMSCPLAIRNRQTTFWVGETTPSSGP
jgi:hypothetical protein